MGWVMSSAKQEGGSVLFKVLGSHALWVWRVQNMLNQILGGGPKLAGLMKR